MASGPLGGLAGLRSLPSSAVRVLGIGVGFVVVVAAVFAGVGVWQDREVSATPDVVEPEPDPAPQPSPAPAPEPDDAPRAQDVSVQLLNGIGSDGGAAVARARTALTDEGFRITAERNARAYDVTTIFYTVGFEDEGRLVGRTLDVTEIRPMTDLPAERRLSDGVMVHVVLGSDRR